MPGSLGTSKLAHEQRLNKPMMALSAQGPRLTAWPCACPAVRRFKGIDESKLRKIVRTVQPVEVTCFPRASCRILYDTVVAILAQNPPLFGAASGCFVPLAASSLSKRAPR